MEQEERKEYGRRERKGKDHYERVRSCVMKEKEEGTKGKVTYERERRTKNEHGRR